MSTAGPLAGLRILDFSHMIAGPYATWQLAALGAEVIKIESHLRPDNWRRRDGNKDVEKSVPFSDYNRGKRSLTVNLKHPQGVELIHRLVQICDVAIENFSAGVMERLGIGYTALRAARPDLIYITVPGIGSDGPRHDYVSWGPNLLAFTGFSYLWNHPDAPAPVGSQTSYPDFVSALHAAAFIVAAVHRRRLTGRGYHLELSQVEATAYSLGPAYLHAMITGTDLAPRGNKDPVAVPQGCYRCQGEDRWLALSVPDDATWARLADLVPALREPAWTTLLGRRAAAAAIDGQLGAWLAERDRDETVDLLQSAGVPAAPVADAADLHASPHLQERGFLQPVTHPALGQVVLPRLAFRSAGEAAAAPRHAPLLGQDNEYVLHDLLGLSPEEVQSLVECQAVY